MQQNQSLNSLEQVNFLKSFYTRKKLDPHKINPCLLQTLQKIKEKDGRENQIFAHDCILESIMDNNDDAHSPSPNLQQNQILDDSHIKFLKSFYGNRKLDHAKLHPFLLQTLQEIEQKEGENCFLEDVHTPDEMSCDPNFEKDPSHYECVKEDEAILAHKDICQKKDQDEVCEE